LGYGTHGVPNQKGQDLPPRILLGAADRYALRWYITALTGEEAASQAFGDFVKMVQDPAGAPFLADRVLILTNLIHRAKGVLCLAHRLARRHGGVSLSSAGSHCAGGPSPEDEVDSDDLQKYLIRLVRDEAAGPCADCFELCLRGYSIRAISKQLSSARTNVGRLLDDAWAVVSKYLRSETDSI